MREDSLARAIRPSLSPDAIRVTRSAREERRQARQINVARMMELAGQHRRLFESGDIPASEYLRCDECGRSELVDEGQECPAGWAQVLTFRDTIKVVALRCYDCSERKPKTLFGER